LTSQSQDISSHLAELSDHVQDARASPRLKSSLLIAKQYLVPLKQMAGKPRTYDTGSDDSDVQEVAVIPPRDSRVRPTPTKRRKSSPQMDPVPDYTPTPLHILEQRARASTMGYSYSTDYTPTPISTRPTSPSLDPWDSNPSARDSYSHADYTPLLEPSPSVVGRTVVALADHDHPSHQQLAAQRSTPSAISRPPAKRPATSCSGTALRPVSGALAQAVARRRSSQADKDKQATLDRAASIKSTSAYTERAYAEQPVMWSPQLPSLIQPIKSEEGSEGKQQQNKGKDEGDEYAKYKSPRVVKQRVAHKPTVAQNKNKQPRIPLGTSKKVPIALRVRYLEVLVNEYLNTGHREEESYELALKEEQNLANRAANKSIYINLVAGMKKRIREAAGVSTVRQDDDPKYVGGNKVVSHSEIITGKVIGTISIERKRKNSDPAELSECELYDRLQRYILPSELLEAYGYPCRDPDEPCLRKVPLGKDGQKQQLRPELASTYTCERCAKVYRVDPEGMQLSTTGKCIYHPGHLWNERISRSLEKRYSCCKGDPSAGGCSSNPYHVHRGELELENFRGYVETQPKPDRDPNKHGIYALDCEMCYTTYGLELTRVTVINFKSEVVYEKLVRPANQILDYNTKYSGIKDGDLDNIETRLCDVQQDLLNMFSSKTILVGHSLDSDMKALKIFHKKFIDTAQLFPHKRGLPYKRALRTLMVENLRVIIQEDAGHDSKEDASAAFRLVMWKAKTDVPEKC